MSFLIQLFFLSLLFLTSLLTTPPVLAQATSTDTGWVITDFNSQIYISPQTLVTIEETISVDFGTLVKHGIYRTIPIKYTTKSGNQLNIRPKAITVTNPDGLSIPFTISYPDDNIQLKIGDPDKTVSGAQTYHIHYQVVQVITKPNESAELYWNVTGNNWPVPILKATSTLTAPSKSIQNSICFTGYFGDTQTDCTHGHDQTTAVFTSHNLVSGQGLTISVAIDPASLQFPSQLIRFVWFFQDNWPYLLPLVTLAIMTNLYWHRGRDRQFTGQFSRSGSQPIPLLAPDYTTTIYSPPTDLSPGEVGTLFDEQVNNSDITATIIDLARRGFFIIKEHPAKGWFNPKKFELIRQNKPESNLKLYEKSILDMFFSSSRKDSVMLNKLPANAYRHLEKAQKHLYTQLTTSGYFSGNPQTVRIVYLIFGIVVSILGLIIISPVLARFTSQTGSYVGTIASGLVVVAFSFFMPARTPKGTEALRNIIGLKRWISLGAWREQIHEKHNFFEEVLPFAIAFGLTHKFIAAFKDAKLTRPDWYQSTGTFNPIYFNRSISSLNSSLNTGIAATRPKSSAASGGSGFSGGSSGGGFGGGGGGSW